MKVWITKYSLTQGIIEAEATISSIGNGEMIELLKDNGNVCGIYFYGKGKEWHELLEEAVVKFEEMRDKKIVSLQKQIEKLSNMEIKVTKYLER